MRRMRLKIGKKKFKFKLVTLDEEILQAFKKRKIIVLRYRVRPFKEVTRWEIVGRLPQKDGADVGEIGKCERCGKIAPLKECVGTEGAYGSYFYNFCLECRTKTRKLMGEE